MKLCISAIAMIFIIFTFGCAQTVAKFDVNIDSIGNADESDKSYLLLPGNKDTNIESLQFKEYASYIEHALFELGFVKAKDFENADIAIFLGYGIGDPQEQQYTYSLPIWGQTGVSSSHTTGTLSSYGNYGSYSGTTTYTPKYGITGSRTHSRTYTTYLRFMYLDAIDVNEYKKSEKEVQLWKTTVTSTGSNGDLRRVFPILLAASKEYIGKNTGNKVTVSLAEEDPRVLQVKGITANKPKF